MFCVEQPSIELPGTGGQLRTWDGRNLGQIHSTDAVRAGRPRSSLQAETGSHLKSLNHDSGLRAHRLRVPQRCLRRNADGLCQPSRRCKQQNEPAQQRRPGRGAAQPMCYCQRIAASRAEGHGRGARAPSGCAASARKATWHWRRISASRRDACACGPLSSNTACHSLSTLPAARRQSRQSAEGRTKAWCRCSPAARKRASCSHSVCWHLSRNMQARRAYPSLAPLQGVRALAAGNRAWTSRWTELPSASSVKACGNIQISNSASERAPIQPHHSRFSLSAARSTLATQRAACSLRAACRWHVRPPNVMDSEGMCRDTSFAARPAGVHLFFGETGARASRFVCFS